MGGREGGLDGGGNITNPGIAARSDYFAAIQSMLASCWLNALPVTLPQPPLAHSSLPSPHLLLAGHPDICTLPG